MICLDTNIVISVINERKPHVSARYDAELARGTQLFLPVIVLYELEFGIAGSDRPAQSRAALAEFLSFGIEVLNFDSDDAREAGEIRAQLKRTGSPIGPYDVLIAAQARRRGALLVSDNQREFQRVLGLMTTDWGAIA